MSFKHLSQDRILELISALTEAGLVTNKALDSLLTDINVQFVAGLPDDDTPIDRLFKTINELNRVEQLIDGTVPFLIWLKNAAARAATNPKATRVIQAALADLSAKGSPARLTDDLRRRFPDQNERVVQSNDLLPYGFLQRGAEAGRSVARVVVPRFDDGLPAMNESGLPKKTLGTGWLLTPDLLITNHHVIDARSAGEPVAAEGDLALQIAGTEVHFDYDEQDTTFVIEQVASLVASSPRTGPLDYAIVRLARDTGRKPLIIARAGLTALANGGDRPSVNIIQHPEGSAKKVACRNNLVTRIDGSDIWYFTDTMAGSSGSPVFDDRWRVVALHKKWDFVTGVTYQGKDTAWVNVGTQMRAIIEDLSQKQQAALLGQLVLG